MVWTRHPIRPNRPGRRRQIFVSDLSEVVLIRTGESGETAIERRARGLGNERQT